MVVAFGRCLCSSLLGLQRDTSHVARDQVLSNQLGLGLSEVCRAYHRQLHSKYPCKAVRCKPLQSAEAHSASSATLETLPRLSQSHHLPTPKRRFRHTSSLL